jgi:hypothetical protein
MACHTPL